ncbi:MAG: ATP-dependent RNA helicase HrpA [Burkholderiales bacterium]|nr:ATP-dependent RNA helicase HrpA [Burkholderiales bacterium]
MRKNNSSMVKTQSPSRQSEPLNQSGEPAVQARSRLKCDSHKPTRVRPNEPKTPITPEQILALQAKIQFPDTLPVSLEKDAICDLIANNQVVIICGETGSGKTTQLPKMCLSLGRGIGAGGRGLIGHTQPRRLAATSTAKRIAEELNSELGQIVGYKIRFADKLQKSASIKLMTDGILLAETQTDRLLRQYDTIIIDEAHERSLNIDFLLGYLKEILPKRPDLKIIITSATIDANRFAEHFSVNGKPAPIINVTGRTYPVEVRYRPIQATENDKERDLYDGIVDAVDELAREQGNGDVLVFLPGEREIREAAEHLRKHHPAHTEILPLFARLSPAEQERIFKHSNARRIVLATNVAETSLTVPGIRYVVDAGLARVKRYSYRQKVEQLQVEPISKAAANQRAGRCGRVAAGVCIRLYDEQDFHNRSDFTAPEILRSSLANVILRMKALGLTQIEQFPFVQAPPAKAIGDGYHLLQELGAFDTQNNLTNVGRALAKLPIDPRVSRMILAARDMGALREVLIIAAALSVQDVRDRPQEARQQADAAHVKFADPQSEFLSYLKIWQWFEQAVAHKKSNRQLQELCRANFLNHLRLREWRDVHSQLRTQVLEQGWRENQTEPTYEQLHCALLTGLLGNVGFKNEAKPLPNATAQQQAHQAKLGQRAQFYTGARGIQFYLWPGSSVSKKNASWVMAGELVETSRLFARTIAKIEVKWLEQIAPHLLNKTYSEPRWRKKSGQVQADERATLYGLVVYSARPVSYARINPIEAREIFIRDGVAQHEIEGRFPFIAHNTQLIHQIEKLEHKSRRQDVLVDDELIVAFYDSVIPKDICDVRALQKWHDTLIKTEPKKLYLSREELMRHEAAGVTSEVFPKAMNIGGVDCALTYHFEPGSHRDGVTLAVPVTVLNFVSQTETEWLVAGMIKEKVQALLKSLPQKLRRHCVPLPEFTQEFIDWANAERKTGQVPLVDTIIEYVRLKTMQQLKTSDFKLETLSPHSFMNFKLLDEYGRQIEMSRNLTLLRQHFGQQARASFQNTVQDNLQQVKQQTQQAEVSDDKSLDTQANSAPTVPNSKIVTWTFGQLPELMSLQKGKQTLFGYPALQDMGEYCELSVWDDEVQARVVHDQGILRLARIALKDNLKHLEKNIPDATQMGMLYVGLTGGTLEHVKADILTVSLRRACQLDDAKQQPTDEASFNAMIAHAKTRLGLIVQEVGRLVLQILTEWQNAQKKLNGIKIHANQYKDISEQIAQLTQKGFIERTAYAQLSHYPRYFKAIIMRCDKLKGGIERDSQLMRDMLPLQLNWQREYNAQRAQGEHSVDVRLMEFRWLLEELRVGLFAQELRTPMPVSVKRLYKIWEAMGW